MTDRGPDSQVFAWQAHPAREQCGRALAGLAVIAVLAAGAASLMQSAGWGVLAAVILLVALNRFYLPSRFSIDAEGISAAFPLRRQRLLWADLARFAHDRRGGLLTTGRQPSWRDALLVRANASTMPVLFGSEPDEVIERIREHVPAGGRQWAR